MTSSSPHLTTLTRTSSHGSTVSKTPKKNLSFSENLCKVQFVESFVTPDTKNAIWYEGRELGGMRKKEIKKVKHAQIMAGQGNSIEDEDLTWRGFEDIQGQWCRVEKSAEYTTAVVKHYHNQVNQGYFDANELKKIAKGLSKQERIRARNLALKDMEDAGIKTDKKSRLRKSTSNITPLPKPNSRGSMTNIRKSMSGAGLATLRKNASKNSMVKLIGKSMGMNRGDNFQWRPKKNGADAPARLAVMSA